MTEIDVPDWVVEAGVQAMQTVTHWDSHEDFRQKVSQAVITAALGAWVVPGPYRFLKNGDNPSEWFDRQINGEPPNPKHLREDFSIQNAYTLRQEKPE